MRVAAAMIVLTAAGLTAAKMHHTKPASIAEAQPVATSTEAEVAAAPAEAALSSQAMFPLGVPPGLAARADHAASTPAALDHLQDLEQVRAAGSGGVVWNNSRWYRSGGSSSAFGGHGFGAGGGAMGGGGMGGGRAPHPAATSAVVTTNAVAPKAPTSPKAPTPPRSTPTLPVAAPMPAVAPITSLAPPIFANQTTPLPSIAGTTTAAASDPVGSGPAGGGVPGRGQNLSATPEPASLLLIVTGLVGVIGATRRRQRQL